MAVSGELFLAGTLEESEGALVFRLQAENLPDPHELLIPVRVSVNHKSVFEQALQLVENVKAN